MSASKAAAMLRIMGVEDPRFVAWVVAKIGRGQPPQQTASLCHSRRLAESNRCYLSKRAVHVNQPRELS